MNDAPVNTVPGAQSVNEDTALPIAGVSVADVDSTPLTTTLTVANGTLSVTRVAAQRSSATAPLTVTLSGTPPQINAALAGLSYTGNLDFNGSDTLTVTTGDGTAQDIDTVAITVNPVNDAPVNTVPGAQTAQEDTPLLIAGLSVADVDSPTLTVTLSVLNGSVAIVPGLALLAGNLSDTVTISGTLAEVNLALASVHYLGDPNFSGSDTLTVTTSDGALSDIDTVAITVAAVADAPVLDLDADNSSGAPGSGYLTTFTENGPPVALTDTDLVLDRCRQPEPCGRDLRPAQCQGGRCPGGDWFAPGRDLGRFHRQPAHAERQRVCRRLYDSARPDRVREPGRCAGPARPPHPGDGRRRNRDHERVYAGPDHHGERRAGEHGAGRAERQRGHGAADRRRVGRGRGQPGADHHADGDQRHAQRDGRVAAQRSPATAPLRSRSREAPPQINAALAGLSYTGNLNFNGSDTLTVTTGDGTAQDIDTVAITVNAVNDAPVNTVPGAQSVNEDTALPIAGVSVADVDSAALTTTLTVTSGTLNVTTGGGATIARQRHRRRRRSREPPPQINAALAGLAYTGNLNFNGSDTLTVTTSDGTAQDIDTVAITVNPVNDAPVNTVPGAQTVNEDTALPIAGVSVADVDGGALDHHADGDERHR